MKTEIELALAEPQSIEALQAALRSAGDETDRVAQLAEDLLLLARADAGALPIRRAPILASELLGGVATRYERRARDASRSIAVVAPPDLTILADRLRLEQALANLVDNALRYGEGTIELRAVEGERIELHVGDEGPGFPAGFLDHAFERFSRADEARSRGGAGLGLSIVAAIAQAHAGEAKAANRSGGGADVMLALPRQAAQDEPTS
jgi:signal transduction histidine kinase